MTLTQTIAPTLEAVTATTFRRACGHFATGVTIVTVRGPDSLHGMTANSFTSVSLDPPLVLVSVDHRRQTYDLLEASEYFGVSVLSETQRELSDRFAGRHGDVQNDFTSVPHVLFGDGLPLIEGAIARFVCRRTAIYPTGDHSLFIGHVEYLDYQADAAPLLYYGGDYRTF